MSKHSPEPWTSVYGSAEGGCVRPLRCCSSLLVALRCLFDTAAVPCRVLP